MHKLIFLGLALLGFSLASAQQFQSPIEYFDYFNQEHAALAQKNMEYMQYAIHSDDLAALAQQRMSLLEQIEGATQRVNALEDYPQDAGIKEAMLGVLAVYKESFGIEFNEVELLKSNSQESFEAMERYIEAHAAAEKKLAAAHADFLQAQRNFAQTNRISLVEGANNSEVEQLNELNTYQRGLFLRSFRVNKANANFLDALDRQDATAMKQLRQSLLDACEEELPALQKIEGFGGDTGYRDAIIEQVKGLQHLAEHDYQALIKVIGTEQSDLTNEDVNAYNQAIQKLNTALGPLSEQVNTALQQLLRNNVPKPAVRGTKQI